jgi:hypothetical protein
VQNLSGCAISGRVGNADTNRAFTGSIISTNAGTFSASVVLPPVNPCYIEVTVSNVNVYTYEKQQINTREHLGQ